MTEADLSQPAEMTAANVATFLFADLVGFTALTEAHGDDEAASLVADFYAAVNAELSARRDALKSIGDALMLRVPEPADAVRLGLHIVHDLMPGHGAPAVRVACITAHMSNATVTSSARPSTWPPAFQARPPVARSC